MKGSDRVIATLNRLLAGELAARDQYFIHSRMYHDWGYHRLFQRIDHETEEETRHADLLIRRILFLEGRPEMTAHPPLRIGADVEEMLRNDLELEYEVVGALKEAIALAEGERDYRTRDMLAILLADTEEDHAFWLEQQLGLIAAIGLENYLQSQS